VPVEPRFGDRDSFLVQIRCQCLSLVALRLGTRTSFHVLSRLPLHEADHFFFPNHTLTGGSELINIPETPGNEIFAQSSPLSAFVACGTPSSFQQSHFDCGPARPIPIHASALYGSAGAVRSARVWDYPAAQGRQVFLTDRTLTDRRLLRLLICCARIVSCRHLLSEAGSIDAPPLSCMPQTPCQAQWCC
jgi:hypothetical protein